jgi:hypothetical protein
MNLVPGITRSRVRGKDHTDNTFFHRDPVTDFELGFVLAARNSSMW